MIDWDQFREDYPTMTFADKRAFYERVAELHPVQRYFDLARAQAAFDEIARVDLTVVELGGWDGALAAQILPRLAGAPTWINYDLVRVPQVVSHLGYSQVVLDGNLWDDAALVFGDVFVATHTIEHLSRDELGALLGCLMTEYVYLEAPLPMVGPVSWRGVEAAHVLDLGWDGVTELLIAAGYTANVLWFPLDFEPIGLPGVGAGLWRRP